MVLEWILSGRSEFNVIIINHEHPLRQVDSELESDPSPSKIEMPHKKYINIPSEKYIYVHKYVYICVYTYLCKMDEYRYYAGLS